MKNSTLRKELVTIKETLNKATLEKEVLQNEKGGLVEALAKVCGANLEETIKQGMTSKKKHYAEIRAEIHGQ